MACCYNILSSIVSEILPLFQCTWLSVTLRSTSPSTIKLKSQAACGFQFLCKHTVVRPASLGSYVSNGPHDALVTPVVIVLCTKLDAGCDRQATVVWLTIDNAWRRSICQREILLSLEVGEKLRGITLIFGDIRISYLFDKYSPA